MRCCESSSARHCVNLGYELLRYCTKDTLASLGRVRFANTVTVTGPSGVLVDEGVTVNNVDISRLLDNVANIGVLMVPDPVTFNQPLTVGCV